MKFLKSEKSNALADEFAKVSNLTHHLHENSTHKLVKSTIKTYINEPSPEIITPITNFQSIKALIKKLPNKKSPGHDRITNEMIKNYPNNIISHLVNIYNA